MCLQKLFLITILVGICVAKCKDQALGEVGSIPCPLTASIGGLQGLGSGQSITCK